MGLLPILMLLLPAGTQLEVRLTTPVGTYASKVGAPIAAVLTVAAPGLPVGSILSGEVTKVRRVGLGIVHETSAMELTFDRIILPDATEMPISARVIEVDNAREHVDSDGLISAQRSTGSLSNRAAGYVRMAVGLNLHAQLGLWAVKTIVVDVPEPEIYYPAGVELTLALTEPLSVAVREETTPRTLTDDEIVEMENLVSGMPARTTNKLHHASDLINVMFVGSRDEISDAFVAAGWSQTPASTLRSHLRNIRAVMGNEGNRIAPMSTLLLEGEAPEMMWQKGFNDVGKRHHIRIWKQTETWSGREIWIGAATHDVDYAFLRPGMPVTHRIAQDVDRERDKVIHDLEFSSCVEMSDLVERPEVSDEMHNATADRMVTDGRIAVALIGGCVASANSPSIELPRHGKIMARLARREILSMRNELVRNNSYWRSYEAARFAIAAARHKRSEVQVARSMGKVSGVLALR